MKHKNGGNSDGAATQSEFSGKKFHKNYVGA